MKTHHHLSFAEALDIVTPSLSDQVAIAAIEAEGLMSDAELKIRMAARQLVATEKLRRQAERSLAWAEAERLHDIETEARAFPANLSFHDK